MNDLIERKYPLNRLDDLGKAPLHYAVQDNRLEVVKRLIEAAANVNAHDERVIGNTQLSDYARECTYEMANVLIDAGADPTMDADECDRPSPRTQGRERS